MSENQNISFVWPLLCSDGLAKVREMIAKQRRHLADDGETVDMSRRTRHLEDDPVHVSKHGSGSDYTATVVAPVRKVAPGPPAPKYKGNYYTMASIQGQPGYQLLKINVD